MLGVVVVVGVLVARGCQHVAQHKQDITAACQHTSTKGRCQRAPVKSMQAKPSKATLSVSLDLPTHAHLQHRNAHQPHPVVG